MHDDLQGSCMSPLNCSPDTRRVPFTCTHHKKNKCLCRSTVHDDLQGSCMSPLNCSPDTRRVPFTCTHHKKNKCLCRFSWVTCKNHVPSRLLSSTRVHAFLRGCVGDLHVFGPKAILDPVHPSAWSVPIMSRSERLRPWPG